MNKKPEDMKINDALDLFEECGQPIDFVGKRKRCNLEEQVGKIVFFRGTLTNLSAEDKLFFSRLQRAIELVGTYLKSDDEKTRLQNLIAFRTESKAQLASNIGVDIEDLSPEIQRNRRFFNKSGQPEMPIDEALDLFDNNDASIRYFGEKIIFNLNEQFGRIIIKENLLVPEDQDKIALLVSMRRAAEEVSKYFKTPEQKQKLKGILDQRASSKRNKGGEKKGAAKNKPGEKCASGQAQKQQSPEQSSHKTAGDGFYSVPGGERVVVRGAAGTLGADTQKFNGDGESAHKADEPKPSVKKIEYVRKGKVGNGNKVAIAEMPNTQPEIKVPLGGGGEMKLDPIQIDKGLLAEVEKKSGRYLDIRRYVITELTPDDRLYINIVFGNLDLDKMSEDHDFLELCMRGILSRKGINTICRDNFCTLGSITQPSKGIYEVVRDPHVDAVVAGSILKSAMKVVRPREKPKGLRMFWARNNIQQSVQENVLKFYKTGVIMFGKKECAIYSYATKDQYTELDVSPVAAGCFMVSGLDEVRFRSGDESYRDSVIRNVLTPENLQYSRGGIEYPYIGHVTKWGLLENDKEINNALAEKDQVILY